MINSEILDDLESSLITFINFLNIEENKNKFHINYKFKKPKKLINFLKKFIETSQFTW